MGDADAVYAVFVALAWVAKAALAFFAEDLDIRLRSQIGALPFIGRRCGVYLYIAPYVAKPIGSAPIIRERIRRARPRIFFARTASQYEDHEKKGKRRCR